MSVPNTNTFTLQDVVDEIGGLVNSLQDCFDNANASGFDPTYEGSKDRLSNFRNYTHVTVYSFTMSELGNASTATACGYTPNLTRYSDTAALGVGVTVYTDSNLTTPFNGNNLYYKEGSNVWQIGTDGIIDAGILCL